MTAREIVLGHGGTGPDLDCCDDHDHDLGLDHGRPGAYAGGGGDRWERPWSYHRLHAAGICEEDPLQAALRSGQTVQTFPAVQTTQPGMEVLHWTPLEMTFEISSVVPSEGLCEALGETLHEILSETLSEILCVALRGVLHETLSEILLEFALESEVGLCLKAELELLY